MNDYRSPVPENADTAPPATSPILAQADATRRMLLLADLQAALMTLGVQCVLARNHRLVLRYNEPMCEPSGLTEPTLHIFTPDGTAIATTDGHAYHLSGGQQCPAGDPHAAAADIAHSTAPRQ